MGTISLQTIARIHEWMPELHFACGLSNISFGLPLRALLNRTFLVMAMSFGLDGAILDPTDEALMSALQSAKTLLGQDPYCADFLSGYREQTLR